MLTLKEFHGRYPLLKTEDFTYRFSRKEGAPVLVLLPGVLGLSDLYYLQFDRLAREFSVFTCNYQTKYATAADFADALAAALERLELRPWLVGQSFGGAVAQILAARHPERIAGLILANAPPLTEQLPPETLAAAKGLLEKAELLRKVQRFLPGGLYAKAVGKLGREIRKAAQTEEERAMADKLCSLIPADPPEAWQEARLAFLLDALRQKGLTADDFAALRGRILLLLPPEADPFGGPARTGFSALLPEISMQTLPDGAHFSTLLRPEALAEQIRAFLADRT